MDELKIVGKSTSNAISHYERRAGKCTAHAEALEQIRDNSSSYTTIDGKQVKCFNFKEAFPHHVDFVWMVADGIKQSLCKRDSFRDYTYSYEPRAAFPHHITIHRIAECIHELQELKQLASLADFIDSFDGVDCVGLEIRKHRARKRKTQSPDYTQKQS